MTPRKRHNDAGVGEERPAKQSQDGEGGRGGRRGGRGGAQQNGQQQQQQRPQSAQPQQGGGRGGRNNNGGQRRPQQQQQPPQQQSASSPQASEPMVDSPSVSSSEGPSKFSDLSFKTQTTFASLGLSAKTAQSLRDEFRYETMSIVQSQCIPVALTGKDIVAKAKTGTGKTLAFLIPLVELVLAKKSSLPAPTGPRPVRALVISPTRELAQQIEEEALRLGKFHSIRLACVVGGLAINKDLRVLQQGQGLDLLIATPGRLKDLLQNHGGIAQSLDSLVALVLDEADRLLDMGFKPDLDAIFRMLPGPDRRQTQLFSATFPANVQEMTARTLKRDHTVVNTVGDEDDQTHKHVMQESIIVPLAQQYEALYELINQHKQANPQYKIIVFFTTARVASFSSRLFNQANCPTLELHSRLSQSKRTKTSDQFREGKQLVLFSSDVSARGLDFPGVSLIIQIGITAADQYVHRLGRTARAGNEGHGIIMLAPFEKRFLSQLVGGGLPIQPMTPPAGSVLAVLADGQTPAYPANYRKGNFAHPVQYAYSLVEGDGSAQDEDSLKGEAESAYRAWYEFEHARFWIARVYRMRGVGA